MKVDVQTFVDLMDQRSTSSRCIDYLTVIVDEYTIKYLQTSPSLEKLQTTFGGMLNCHCLAFEFDTKRRSQTQIEAIASLLSARALSRTMLCSITLPALSLNEFGHLVTVLGGARHLSKLHELEIQCIPSEPMGTVEFEILRKNWSQLPLWLGQLTDLAYLILNLEDMKAEEGPPLVLGHAIPARLTILVIDYATVEMHSLKRLLQRNIGTLVEIAFDHLELSGGSWLEIFEDVLPTCVIRSANAIHPDGAWAFGIEMSTSRPIHRSRQGLLEKMVHWFRDHQKPFPKDEEFEMASWSLSRNGPKSRLEK